MNQLRHYQDQRDLGRKVWNEQYAEAQEEKPPTYELIKCILAFERHLRLPKAHAYQKRILGLPKGSWSLEGILNLWTRNKCT